MKWSQSKVFLISAITVFWVTSESLCCYFLSYANTCSDLEPSLVGRDAWGASSPAGPLECLPQPAAYVIIHHTVTDPCDDDTSCAEAVRAIQKEHIEVNKWPDIGYHFVICGNGKAYAGRPGYKVGGHTKYHNRVSVGIAFLGDFGSKSPSTDMLDLVPKIVFCGVKQGYIRPDFQVIAHKDAYCSPCPGNALYQVVQSWPRYPKTVPIPSYTCDAPTTTAAPTTTTTTTAATTTTTTEATTTTTEPPTTTAVTTTKSPWSVFQPIYYYVVMSKKPLPADIWADWKRK